MATTREDERVPVVLFLETPDWRLISGEAERRHMHIGELLRQWIEPHLAGLSDKTPKKADE